MAVGVVVQLCYAIYYSSVTYGNKSGIYSVLKHVMLMACNLTYDVLKCLCTEPVSLTG